MAPRRLVLRQQLQIMLDYMDENKSLSNGSSQGIFAKEEARQKWATLTKKLNAIPGGATRTPECWRRYWIEWRYKVRRKASDEKRFEPGHKGLVPLDDLEIRVLEFCKKSALMKDSSNKETENLTNFDSDTEKNDTHIKFETSDNSIFKEEIGKSCSRSRISIDDPNSPPPQWALALEDRRITAEERVASALESIAVMMQKQEERRITIQNHVADALTALVGTMQELKNGLQESVQILRQLHPNSAKEHTPPVENIFLIE